jgi:hypothetical protein
MRRDSRAIAARGRTVTLLTARCHKGPIARLPFSNAYALANATAIQSNQHRNARHEMGLPRLGRHEPHFRTRRACLSVKRANRQPDIIRQ